jgi:hypothetical protein
MKTSRPSPFERTSAESPVNRDDPKEEFSPIHSRYSSLSFHKVLIFYQSIPLNKEFTFSISTSRNIPIYYLQNLRNNLSRSEAYSTNSPITTIL